MTDIVLRDLSGMADFFLAEALQRDVWGQDDATDPPDLMMVIQAEGGLAAGAFRGEALLGYVFGFAIRNFIIGSQCFGLETDAGRRGNVSRNAEPMFRRRLAEVSDECQGCRPC